jgi:hypothetical protein
MTIESSVQTLLGALVSGRCYPVINTTIVITRPYITYQVISGGPLLALANSANPEEMSMQIDIWDSTYGGAKTLAQSVKTAMLGASFANVQTMDQDMYEGVSKEYRVMLEYSIWA